MLLEKVNNITEWINEIEPGEVKSAYLPCARLQSLNCLASRFNQSRGKERDKFVHYHFAVISKLQLWFVKHVKNT